MHHVTVILITEELITVERLGIIHLDQNIATTTGSPTLQVSNTGLDIAVIASLSERLQGNTPGMIDLRFEDAFVLVGVQIYLAHAQILPISWCFPACNRKFAASGHWTIC